MFSRVKEVLRRKGILPSRFERDRKHTAELLDTILSPKSNCVDIGAHKGAFLRQITQRSPEGQHIAVEALPDFAERVRKEYPQVEVHACAMDALPGKATFYRVVGGEAWSGLRQHQHGDLNARSEPFEVDVRRLDDIVPDDRQIDFVKIDVEGAELGVFKGAAEVLKRWHPVIYFEHASIHADAYDTSPEDISDVLTSYGFSLYTLGGRKLDRGAFASLCRDAAASNYGPKAHTNFLAVAGDYPVVKPS